jgi:hypothetical protein
VAALAPGAFYFRIEPPSSGVSMIESDDVKLRKMEEETRAHFRSCSTARELCRKLVRRGVPLRLDGPSPTDSQASQPASVQRAASALRGIGSSRSLHTRPCPGRTPKHIRRPIRQGLTSRCHPHPAYPALSFPYRCACCRDGFYMGASSSLTRPPSPSPCVSPQVMQQWWELFADATWQAYAAGAAAVRGFLGIYSSNPVPAHSEGGARKAVQLEDPDQPLKVARLRAPPGWAWLRCFRWGDWRPSILPVVISPCAREDETLGEVSDGLSSRPGEAAPSRSGGEARAHR